MVSQDRDKFKVSCNNNIMLFFTTNSKFAIVWNDFEQIQLIVMLL